MAVALPLVCFALVVLALPPARALRGRIMSAGIVWGVLVTVICEGTSRIGSLTPRTVTACWGAAALAAGALAVARAVTPASRRSERPSRIVARSPGDTLALALPIAGIVLTTGLVAAAGWPGQWDSMVYHLPRIDHWLQNRSVAFYPTSIVRQLFNPPWAEYAMLQLIATGGDERWGNGVQWFAMAGSLVGVSLIAKHLGAGLRGQLFAVLFCVTIPMGIMQASGTQNDYVTAFWLVCMVEALLSTAPAVTSGAGALRVGAAFGLAALSKGTAGVFGIPLLVTLWPWGTRPLRATLCSGMLAAVIALALDTPHLARNLETFGSPLGPPTPGSATGNADDNLVNEAMSPGIFASNLVRNLSLHAGTRAAALNAAVQHGIERAHTLVGLDVNDPRSTRLYPLPRFAIDANAADPDRTGSPVHLGLIVVAAGMLTLGQRRVPRLGRYALGLTLAFVGFNLVFKWQPWHARLHLPLFVLVAPLIGVVAEPWRRCGLGAGLVLTLLAAPPLLANYLGPLDRRRNVFNTPRIQQYFHVFREGSDERERAYVGAAEFLLSRQCRDVGVRLGWDDWEHPLWVLLGDGARVRHVAVDNVSATLADREPQFTPCGVVAGSATVDELAIPGGSYRPAWSRSGLEVLLRVDASAAATVR